MLDSINFMHLDLLFNCIQCYILKIMFKGSQHLAKKFGDVREKQFWILLLEPMKQLKNYFSSTSANHLLVFEAFMAFEPFEDFGLLGLLRLLRSLSNLSKIRKILIQPLDCFKWIYNVFPPSSSSPVFSPPLRLCLATPCSIERVLSEQLVLLAPSSG